MSNTPAPKKPSELTRGVYKFYKRDVCVYIKIYIIIY